MITRLAITNLRFRPWRSVLLFLGYGVGVGVMIVLLAVGDALVTQARDEKLIGGGEITVLPEGLDVEVMKTGGVGGLYFSIDHSRFLYRQLLASPRLAPVISAVAPQIDGKLLYLRTRAGAEIPARSIGEIPDATRGAGAAPSLLAGSWHNDDGDRQYIAPTLTELRHEIDHFHTPPAQTADPETWAEWHYFNVLSDDHQRWTFITFLIGGDVRTDRWGGRIMITRTDRDGHTRRYVTNVPRQSVVFSTSTANVTIGASSVTVLPDGRYHVQARATEEHGSRVVTVDLIVTPAPNAYFPGASLGGAELVSGYVVPGLRADAVGEICEDGVCDHFDHVQAYHDHNWGTWRGVTWDWGAARAGSYTFLYGRVVPPDDVAEAPPFLVYLVDSLGFRAVFRPQRIAYTDTKTITVHGETVHVPSRAEFADVRGSDTVRVRLDIASAIGSGDHRPYFIQMQGTATITGRVGGAPLSGSGAGFFETYR